MPVANLIAIPCLSVFSASVAATTPTGLTVPAATPVASSAIVTAALQVSADDLNAAQLEEASDELTTDGFAEAEAPYGVDMPQVPVTTASFSQEPVFSDKSDDEVFQIASAYLQDLGTMKARFTQTAPSGNISSGELHLARPGRLRFEYDEPVPVLIVANQGLVYVHDSELETTDSYPVNRTPLKFLLNRRVKTDDVILDEVYRTENSFSLTLSSSDEETEGKLVMVFQAPDIQLRRWAVYDPAGNLTQVDLDQIEVDVKVPNNSFRVPEAGGFGLRDR